ncbi:MAG: hypothetical protein AB7V62_01660 [Thermoleophilia bacterium]
MSRRRLALQAPDGVVTVTDLSRPGARLLEITLPDGATVHVAEHLCGWAAGDGGRGDEPEPLWPTMADAVAALSGRTRDGEAWISVLEEFATTLAPTTGTPLPAADEERLAALLRRHPALYVDGPRAHDSGGWYLFVGGLPDDTWVLEIDDTPEGAARAALARAEAALDEAGL